MLEIRRSTPLSALLAVCFSLSCYGCGASADDATAAGSGGGGGSGGQIDLPSSLAFEPSDTLKMIPGEGRTLTVVAVPAKSYPVHFVLLGQFADASLDRSEVVTGDDGRATVQLVAPTTPTTFSLRASVGESVSAQAGVSVSASGFATLQVEPSYSGKRSISGWVASVRAGSACSDLVGNPPPDGDLKASSLPEQIPQIDGVPVGPSLAVTLRAGYYVYGCKELNALTAGEINPVVIPVSDVPLKVDETDLVIGLTMDPPAKPIEQTFAATLSTATKASLGGAGDDVEALLDAMQLVTPTAQDASAFDAQSQAGSWHTVLTAALGGPTTAPTATRTMIQAWLTQGAKNLSNAHFSGTLTSAGKVPGQAYLELNTVAGIDAALAGFTQQNLASWQSDPGDTVLLGTTFYAVPSQLFTALALGPALAAAPGAKSVPGAIADLLSCQNVAAALVSAGAQSGHSYAGCDATCTETLCRAALAVEWELVQDATATTGSPAATLVLSATGAASVDEYARPTGFDGSWVGTLGAGELKTSVGGSASGAMPPPPK